MCFVGVEPLQGILEQRQRDLGLRYILFHVVYIDYLRKGYIVVSFCSILVTYKAEEQTVFAPIA